MKSISPALKAHLAQPTTTLAQCWLLVRTDGMQVGFTTLDADLTVGGVLYRSTHGFSRSAISTGSRGEVDNLEVIGYFADDGIVERDVRNGLFNYASIYLFCVNYMDLTQGILRLRRGWLGECTRLPNGSFHAELRGIMQALTQEFGNIMLPNCRADLGDDKCLVPIAPAAWVAGANYPAGLYAAPLTKSTDALRVAIFRSAGGTAGSTEPAWNTSVGATTSDGTITWTSAQPLRLIGTVAAPVDTHSFVVQPLALPGADLGDTAAISIRNAVTAGTSIEIDDGNGGVIQYTWVEATAHDTVAAELIAAITAASGTGIRITSVTGSTNLALTNSSGKQGNITKTGDAANPPAFNVINFSPNYLDGGTITWLSGLNAGASVELKTYVTDTTTVVTWLGQNYPPQIGDRFFYYPGCDKTRETCYYKFNNILNFRGEPDVPGLDRALGYPDSP